MAVMASQFMDKPAFEPKVPLGPSSEVVSLNGDMNGLAPKEDALFQDGDTDMRTQPNGTDAPEQPALNGTSSFDAPISSDGPVAPTEDATSNTAPTAPDVPITTTVLPTTSTTEYLAEPSDPITEIPPAVEAPTSDAREEPLMEQSTQPTDTDAMEIATDPVSNVADSKAEEPIQTTEAVAEPIKDFQDNSKVETSPTASDAPANGQEEPISDSVAVELAQSADEIMTDAPSQSKVRAREDDEMEEEPIAKRTKVSPEGEPRAPSEITSSNLPAAEVAVAEPRTAPPSGAATPVLLPQMAHQAQYTPKLEHFDNEPMTPKQKAGLLKVLQSAKKAKVAQFFKEPVDYVVLNIPSYPDIVKEPMDLKTMETKLKDNKYSSVDGFLGDLALIIHNTYLFNGPAHAVTESGRNLEAYMVKSIQNNATRQAAPEVPPPKATPAAEKKEMRRRSTTTKVEKPVIVPPPPPPAPAAASPTTYAPIDGVPIIRRDSTTNDGRPKREIQRPKPRDLPYSIKPRKKKFQVELKFCEMILTEVKKQKHAKFTWPFMNPVDPVALNIPTYHKVIKKPMDTGTIDKKFKQGDYQTSKDFKSDFELMFANCYKFNPETDEVHKMGKAYNELFNELWSTKDEWIQSHQPQSEPMSSAEESDDEEASEDEQDIRQHDLVDIQRQIAELTNKAQAIIQNATKQPSPKLKGKKNKTKVSNKSKKGGSVAAAKPTKTKKTKVQPLSFAQKQEISESIGQLNEVEMGKAMQIIKNGCPHLGNGDDEELEIDMEMIPEDVLRQLFKFVRSVRPAAQKQEISDDDFEPARTAPKSSKSKKNKPMNKKEQEDSIEAIKRQLESFKQGASSEEPVSPANHDESSSDDDADSESEEE